MLEREDAFYESHPDPVWLCDVKTLRRMHVNQAAIETYGYSCKACLSLDLLASIRPAAYLFVVPKDIRLDVSSDPARGRDKSRLP